MQKQSTFILHHILSYIIPHRKQFDATREIVLVGSCHESTIVCEKQPWVFKKIFDRYIVTKAQDKSPEKT